MIEGKDEDEPNFKRFLRLEEERKECKRKMNKERNKITQAIREAVGEKDLKEILWSHNPPRFRVYTSGKSIPYSSLQKLHGIGDFYVDKIDITIYGGPEAPEHEFGLIISMVEGEQGMITDEERLEEQLNYLKEVEDDILEHLLLPRTPGSCKIKRKREELLDKIRNIEDEEERKRLREERYELGKELREKMYNHLDFALGLKQILDYFEFKDDEKTVKDKRFKTIINELKGERR